MVSLQDWVSALVEVCSINMRILVRSVNVEIWDIEKTCKLVYCFVLFCQMVLERKAFF